MVLLLPFIFIFVGVFIFGCFKKNKAVKIIGAAGALLPTLCLLVLFFWDDYFMLGLNRNDIRLEKYSREISREIPQLLIRLG